MKRRNMWIPAGSALLALAALAAVGCANPADDKTEAIVADPVAETATAVEGEPYVISAESKITWVGSKVTGSHDGGFERFEGEISVVDADPTKSSVKIVIDAASLWSDNPKLTDHLKSPDFFDVATYPTATFKSTQIRQVDDGFEVTGNLELHGVTKSITFPAQITLADGSVTAQAEFFIQRFDFDIVYPGRPDDLIRDEVVIRFDLTAAPAAAAAAAETSDA